MEEVPGLGRLLEVLEDFNTILQEDPGVYKAYAFSAIIYHSLGNIELAKKDLESFFSRENGVSKHSHQSLQEELYMWGSKRKSCTTLRRDKRRKSIQAPRNLLLRIKRIRL